MSARSDEEKFWAQDPCVLLTNLSLLPTASQTKDQKLNALTRLAIIISIVLYFMKYEYALQFALCAVLVILLLKYAGNGSGDHHEPKKEGFTIVPTYANPDMQQTTVSPLFSEEWQIIPPAYDLYTNVPEKVTFQAPLQPQTYPYGQFLSVTNLLPSDEQASRMLNGGPKQAREYANSSFLRHRLAFSDNMTKLYKLKLDRRYRQSGADSFSPYSSY